MLLSCDRKKLFLKMYEIEEFIQKLFIFKNLAYALIYISKLFPVFY